MRLVVKLIVAVLVVSIAAHVASWMTTGIKHAAANYQQHVEVLNDAR